MRALFITAVGLVTVGTATQAAQLLSYTFGTTGQETASETSPAFGATIVGSNLSATPVRDLNGQVGIEISSAATTPLGAPFLRVDPQGNSTTAAAAVTAGKYFEFTITPDPGYATTFDSITYQVARGGAGTPRGYVLRSSVDNFAANLAGGDVTTARPTYTNADIPLGTAFDDLQSPTTFRFYVYAPNAGNSLDFDNIVINGSVTQVPEPTTTALIVGGILGIAALSRRRRAA